MLLVMGRQLLGELTVERVKYSWWMLKAVGMLLEASKLDEQNQSVEVGRKRWRQDYY